MFMFIFCLFYLLVEQVEQALSMRFRVYEEKQNRKQKNKQNSRAAERQLQGAGAGLAWLLLAARTAGGTAGSAALECAGTAR